MWKLIFLSGLMTAAVTAQRPSLKRDLPTIFVVGDSTAKNGEGRGWGDPLALYFDTSTINVANRARAGRSSRTFLTEGLWDNVLAEIKANDWVLIQFGHNDGGPLDTGRARGSLPGLGEEMKEVTLPNGKTEVVRTFGWYMRKIVADVKAKSARPILLSLTVRNIWTDGKVERGSGQFGAWTAQIARAERVPFLDLTTGIADRYEQMGVEQVKEFFPEDHTHTTPAGADLNASLVVAGLRSLPNAPFAKHLSNKGRSVTPPARPLVTSERDLRLPVPADPKLPTLFLIGDSTVRNGRGDGSNGQWGWGEPLFNHFDSKKVNVVNRAVGGLSSRTFLTGGHWDRVLGMLKPGDVVIIQFGHNDSGALDDPARARGTIRGVGEETREIDNPITKQREVVHSYGWYLRKYVADTKARGATPIICSLVPRKIWKNGKIVRNSEDYQVWAREVATAEMVGFVDLNEMIARRYDALGPEKVDALFADEHTHTSRTGAELNAAVVLDGLKALKANPVRRFF